MATKQRNIQYIFLHDWETSGAEFGTDSSKKYQGIACGIAIVDAKTLEPIETDKFYVKFDETKYQWSMEAQAIHGLTREFLEENGLSQEDAAIRIIELILKYWGPDEPVMVAGHNVDFDLGFTNQTLNVAGFEFSFMVIDPEKTHIPVFMVKLDTSPLGFIAFGLYKSELLFQHVGCAPRGDHDPLEDVINTLTVMQTVRGLVQHAMGEVQ